MGHLTLDIRNQPQSQSVQLRTSQSPSPLDIRPTLVGHFLLHLDIDQRRLGVAWDCVLEEFFSRCVSDALKHGEGMSAFRMRSNETADDTRPEEAFNCDYYYTKKGTTFWDSIFNRLNPTT